MWASSSPSRPDRSTCACRTAQSMPFRNCATVELGVRRHLELGLGFFASCGPRADGDGDGVAQDRSRAMRSATPSGGPPSIAFAARKWAQHAARRQAIAIAAKSSRRPGDAAQRPGAQGLHPAGTPRRSHAMPRHPTPPPRRQASPSRQRPAPPTSPSAGLRLAVP